LNQSGDLLSASEHQPAFKPLSPPKPLPEAVVNCKDDDYLSNNVSTGSAEAEFFDAQLCQTSPGHTAGCSSVLIPSHHLPPPLPAVSSNIETSVTLDQSWYLTFSFFLEMVCSKIPIISVAEPNRFLFEPRFCPETELLGYCFVIMIATKKLSLLILKVSF